MPSIRSRKLLVGKPGFRVHLLKDTAKLFIVEGSR